MRFVTRRFQVAAIWLIVSGAATYLSLFDPARGGYPGCPFRLLTGLQCPGCGAARSLHQLLHGHPITAFELNPLVLISLPFLVLGLFCFTRSAITGETLGKVVVPPRYGWLIIGVLVSFWIFRNTPIYPFPS